MKICLVAQEYPPDSGGGIATQTYVKAQGLAARGHEVRVVSVAGDDRGRTYRDGGATVHRMPLPATGAPGYEQSTWWLAHSTRVAEHVSRLHEELAFDIIQFPEYCGEGFVFQTDTFARRTARYVVQCHGPLAMFVEHMGWPERGSVLDRVGTFMEEMSLHHADLVLASSHCTARFCADRYRYPLAAIEVIHSGLDTARFRDVAAAEGAGSPRILFVGNLVDSKGFDLVVDAVLALRERHPQILLRAIGKPDASFVEPARARIAAAGAARNVEIIGYVPYGELPRHYAWCDVFAGPSRYEPGPGNVYLEAMASAKPVIACASGGAPEVVQDDATGLLIPPRDADALTAAIVRLVDDRALRQRLGAAGRAWVESNVSLPRYIDRVERLYLDLLSR